jgi:hypothetical protein
VWRDDPNDPHRGQLDELAAEFPGWQVWCSGPVWCARPEPLINAGSPEELAERIRIAHSSPPDGSPSLATWRTYVTRRRQLREWVARAEAEWLRMRAEADRWRRFPRVHSERRGQGTPEAGGADATAAESPALPDITA